MGHSYRQLRQRRDVTKGLGHRLDADGVVDLTVVRPGPGLGGGPGCGPGTVPAGVVVRARTGRAFGQLISNGIRDSGNMAPGTGLSSFGLVA